MGDEHRHSPLVWIDMEMSGLDTTTCHILEIATFVTASDLEIVAEGPSLIIHQPDEVLDSMGFWCHRHHGASGLTDQVRASKISLRNAEEQTLVFLREHTEAKASPLCGNSIGLDANFISYHMPELHQFLSGQLIDVTSVKEIARRWHYEGVAKSPKKSEKHRARDDILESIAELHFYRQHLFR